MKRWKITEKVQSVRVGRFLIIVERHVESGESHTKKKERKIESVKKDWKHVIQGSTITLSDRFGRSERWTSSRYDKFLLVDPRRPARPGERKLGREGKKRERERGKKNRNRDHFENEIFKRWDGVNYRYVSSSGIADSVQIEPISRDLTYIFYLCSCWM